LEEDNTAKTKTVFCLLAKSMISIVESGKQLLLYNIRGQLHQPLPMRIISISLEDIQVAIRELELFRLMQMVIQVGGSYPLCYMKAFKVL
jgi:hypothetical protein